MLVMMLMSKAVEIQKETGATFLHPFNDKYVIAGKGTMALAQTIRKNDVRYNIYVQLW